MAHTMRPSWLLRYQRQQKQLNKNVKGYQKKKKTHLQYYSAIGIPKAKKSQQQGVVAIFDHEQSNGGEHPWG